MTTTLYETVLLQVAYTCQFIYDIKLTRLYLSFNLRCGQKLKSTSCCISSSFSQASVRQSFLPFSAGSLILINSLLLSYFCIFQILIYSIKDLKTWMTDLRHQPSAGSTKVVQQASLPLVTLSMGL